MKDKFTIWIKNKINGTPTEPPAEVWSKIDNQLDVDASWAEMDRKLDIDQVWGRLDNQLARDYKMKQYERISYAPILLLLLFFSWLTISDQVSNEDSILESKQLATQKQPATSALNEDNDQLSTLQQQGTAAPLNKSESSTKQQLAATQKLQSLSIDDNSKAKDKPQSSVLPQKDVTLALTEPTESINNNDLAFAKERLKAPTNPDKKTWVFNNLVPGTKDDQITFTRLKAIEAFVEFDSIPLKSKPLHFYTLQTDTLENETSNQNLYVAAGVSGSRTTLNDNRFKRASEGSSSVEAIATNKLSANLQIGYAFNNTWAIHSEVQILGNIGQEYGEYINGKYRIGNVDIKYNGLKIGVRRKLPSLLLPGRNIENHLLIGLFADHIYKVEQQENILINQESQVSDLTDNYKNMNLGLWVGLELNHKISSTFKLGTLLSYSYGLNNIYKGNGNVPDYLRRANTSEITLTLFLRKNFVEDN